MVLYGLAIMLLDCRKVSLYMLPSDNTEIKLHKFHSFLGFLSS